VSEFWQKKKVLVTGGAGFIGSHVVDSLLESGATVTAVVYPKISQEKIKQNLKKSLPKITVKRGDLLDFKDCLNLTRGRDIVLNFAAMDGGRSFKIKYPAEIFRVNTQIVLNMLEASRQNNVDRLLLMSSIEIYPTDAPSPIKEEYGFMGGLDEKTEGYTWSKRISEIAGKIYYKEYGLKTAIVRAGNVYGPRDYYVDKERARVIPVFITKALKREDINIWGNGSQKISFLYVTDLVNGLLDLVEKYAVCDPVNFASSHYVLIKGLAKSIINLVGSKSRLKFQKNQMPNIKDRIVDIKKAKKVIGFKEKVELSEGLKKTIKYVKSKNKK